MGWQMDASTTSPLTGSGTYQTAARVVGEMAKLVVATTSNVGGTLLLQESADGSTWTTSSTSTITGGQVTFVSLDLSSIYWRIVYNNGASAQTSFYLGAALSNS